MYISHNLTLLEEYEDPKKKEKSVTAKTTKANFGKPGHSGPSSAAVTSIMDHDGSKCEDSSESESDASFEISLRDTTDSE